jgi:hypothetical protein
MIHFTESGHRNENLIRDLVSTRRVGAKSILLNYVWFIHWDRPVEKVLEHRSGTKDVQGGSPHFQVCSGPNIDDFFHVVLLNTLSRCLNPAGITSDAVFYVLFPQVDDLDIGSCPPATRQERFKEHSGFGYFGFSWSSIDRYNPHTQFLPPIILTYFTIPTLHELNGLSIILIFMTVGK